MIQESIGIRIRQRGPSQVGQVPSQMQWSQRSPSKRIATDVESLEMNAFQLKANSDRKEGAELAESSKWDLETHEMIRGRPWQ